MKLPVVIVHAKDDLVFAGLSLCYGARVAVALYLYWIQMFVFLLFDRFFIARSLECNMFLWLASNCV